MDILLILFGIVISPPLALIWTIKEFLDLYNPPGYVMPPGVGYIPPYYFPREDDDIEIELEPIHNAN